MTGKARMYYKLTEGIQSLLLGSHVCQVGHGSVPFITDILLSDPSTL